MTEIQKEIANRLCPEWEEICNEICQYTDSELSLIQNDLPDDISDFQEAINQEVFCEIINDIVQYAIGEDAYYEYEEWWMDFAQNSQYLSYEEYYRAYCINEEDVKNIVECFKEEYPEFKMDPYYNHSELLFVLNRFHPFKFISTNFYNIPSNTEES